ncbi:MAG: hypothetical protein ACRD9R_23310, partial [Pyrinomonadaceae bacterium]
GNVGTAYRQRSQLLVFYFIFVAVGLVLLRERREDRLRQVRQLNHSNKGLTAATAAAGRPAGASAPRKA